MPLAHGTDRHRARSAREYALGQLDNDPLDRETQGRQERKVSDLTARLSHAQAVLQDALAIFREDPGAEAYWLHLIRQNRHELKLVRANIERAMPKLRLAQQLAHEQASLDSMKRLAHLTAVLRRHEGELRELQEEARLLSAGRQLAATYRQNLVDTDCRICTSPSVAAVNRDFSPTTAEHYGFTAREFEHHRPHVRQWMLRSRERGMELVDAQGNRVDRAAQTNGRRR